MARCPHCRAEIDGLNYSCEYTEYGTEYGSCDLDGGDCDRDSGDLGDYNTDDYHYECPECGHEVEPGDIDRDDDDDDEEEEEEEEDSNMLIGEKDSKKMAYSAEEVDKYEREFIKCPDCGNIIPKGSKEEASILCGFCNKEIIIN